MDYDLEKELKVRKRILAIYNKEREDFDSKESFDDYLEEVEDIIWRLTNNVDLERTERQVRVYQQQNQEQINAKTMRKANLDALDPMAAAAAAQLAAASLASGAKNAPPITGGLPMILPKLAADYSAMLDGARNIKYDGRALATAGPAAAAAAGWSAGVSAARLAKEALSSLLPPVRLVDGLSC